MAAVTGIVLCGISLAFLLVPVVFGSIGEAFEYCTRHRRG